MFHITLNSGRRFSQIRLLLNVGHKGLQDISFADPVLDLARVTIEVCVRYLEHEPVLQSGQTRLLYRFCFANLAQKL